MVSQASLKALLEEKYHTMWLLRIHNHRQTCSSDLLHRNHPTMPLIEGLCTPREVSSVQSDELNSALSPVVYGDIALSINT